LWNETSQGEEDDQESHKEEVVCEKYCGFKSVIFFLTRGGIFVIRSRYTIDPEWFFGLTGGIRIH
jgi:hypothetical protein